MSRLEFLRTYRGSKCDMFEADVDSCKGCHWYPNPMPTVSMCGLPNIAYDRPEIDRILEELCPDLTPCSVETSCTNAK